MRKAIQALRSNGFRVERLKSRWRVGEPDRLAEKAPIVWAGCRKRRICWLVQTRSGLGQHCTTKAGSAQKTTESGATLRQKKRQPCGSLRGSAWLRGQAAAAPPDDLMAAGPNMTRSALRSRPRGRRTGRGLRGGNEQVRVLHARPRPDGFGRLHLPPFLYPESCAGPSIGPVQRIPKALERPDAGAAENQRLLSMKAVS